jgi:hypothetical protein
MRASTPQAFDRLAARAAVATDDGHTNVGGVSEKPAKCFGRLYGSGCNSSTAVDALKCAGVGAAVIRVSIIGTSHFEQRRAA